MPVREQLLPARSQAEEKIEIGKKKAWGKRTAEIERTQVH